MKRMLFNAIATTSLLITSQNIAHAITDHELPIFKQLDIYEYSVNHSSVSNRYNKSYRNKQIAILNKARSMASIGNIEKAQKLLNQVAHNIYGMSDSSTDEVRYSEKYRLNSIFNAIESILPQAQKIAFEKHKDTQPLESVKFSLLQAREALTKDDPDIATLLIEEAYISLQHQVASLRSGDRLTITLPSPNSREGWQDAARRYEDWRYFNKHIELLMTSRGQNSYVVTKANIKADHLYHEAISIAVGEDWLTAVETIDQAYQILIRSWRSVGVDIGA